MSCPIRSQLAPGERTLLCRNALKFESVPNVTLVSCNDLSTTIFDKLIIDVYPSSGDNPNKPKISVTQMGTVIIDALKLYNVDLKEILVTLLTVFDGVVEFLTMMSAYCSEKGVQFIVGIQLSFSDIIVAKAMGVFKHNVRLVIHDWSQVEDTIGVFDLPDDDEIFEDRFICSNGSITRATFTRLSVLNTWSGYFNTFTSLKKFILHCGLTIDLVVELLELVETSETLQTLEFIGDRTFFDVAFERYAQDPSPLRKSRLVHLNVDIKVPKRISDTINSPTYREIVSRFFYNIPRALESLTITMDSSNANDELDMFESLVNSIPENEMTSIVFVSEAGDYGKRIEEDYFRKNALDLYISRLIRGSPNLTRLAITHFNTIHVKNDGWKSILDALRSNLTLTHFTNFLRSMDKQVKRNKTRAMNLREYHKTTPVCIDYTYP